MGVDCRISLPRNVRLQTVAEVIGKLIGLKAERTEQKFVRVPGISFISYPNLIECPIINFDGVAGPAFKWNHDDAKTTVMFHFEPDEGSGRILLPNSTAFWLAVGRKVVDFFGGFMFYQSDDNSATPDYFQIAKSNAENMPSDGKPFWDLEQRIFDLPPITEEEFAAMEPHAAYRTVS